MMQDAELDWLTQQLTGKIRQMTQDNKEHAGLPVKGYKPQSEENIFRVNQMKEAEENVLRMLDALMADPNVDKRWAAIARTNIEQGFMAANRSVFKPSRLALAGDKDFNGDTAGDAPKEAKAMSPRAEAMPPRAEEWAKDASKGRGYYCKATGKEVDQRGVYLNGDQFGGKPAK